jgi:POT family proton-dependent oligopeptide transporter
LLWWLIIGYKRATPLVDSTVWSADPKANTALTAAKLITAKSASGADSIVGIETSGNKDEISNFHLKLIKMANGSFDRAILIEDGKKLVTQEITEKVVDKVEMKSIKIQVWNLAPEKPTFLGMQVKNLYDFFMVFVMMAGASSVILFFLSKKLLKMMHGVQ